MTANDIHNKEFKRSFRGYDEDEIDEFLDQVVNDFDLLSRENVSLKADLARAEKTNEEYKQLKDDINTSVTEVCAHYGVPVIRLKDIDKKSGHPSVKGMRSFASQVLSVIKKK